EKLLSDGRLKRVPVNVLGEGRAVIGGTLSAELTRQEVEETLADGFLPLNARDELPARERRTGLRELGLPYASEPAITKHLAAFVTKSSESGVRSPESKNAPPSTRDAGPRTPDSRLQTPDSSMARPDAILFNGGFFAPDSVRERIVEAVGN